MKTFAMGAALAALAFLPSAQAAQSAAEGRIAFVVTISDAQHHVVASYSETNVIDGKPSVFKSVRDTSFVQSASSTPAGVKLSPGVVHTGWVSTITSKATSGGTAVRISISQSSLQGMRSISDGKGASVQLPAVDAKSITSMVFVPTAKKSITVIPLWHGMTATIVAKRLPA